MLDNILIRFVFSARDAGGKGAVLSFWEVAVRCRAVGDLLIGCVSKAHSRLKARFKGGGDFPWGALFAKPCKAHARPHCDDGSSALSLFFNAHARTFEYLPLEVLPVR